MHFLLLVMVIFIASGCGVGDHNPVSGGLTVTSHNNTAGLDYENTVKVIFINRCGACHNSSSAIPNWQNYQTAYGERAKIFQRVVVDHSMPPSSGPSPITDSERATIGAWIQAGAPDVIGGGGVIPPPEPGASPASDPSAGPAPSPTPVDFGPVKDLVVTCTACHDHSGNSENSNFPRIAGQQTAYLVTTLLAFREHQRKEPDAVNFMWGMTQNKDDDTLKLLALYFNSQIPTPNKKGDAGLAATGQNIYENGIPASGVPACINCHGAHGEGMPTIPRLAGQHIDYLVKQFAAFRQGDRTEATTMPVIVKNLSEEDENAIANYVQGL